MRTPRDMEKMKELTGDQEPNSALSVLRLLRPHLDPKTFNIRLRCARQEGYRLFAQQHKDGRVVGVVGVRIFHDLLDGRCLHIDDLVVHEEFRRQGIATKLMKFSHEFALKNKCCEIRLNSGFSRKEAHAFYESIGMKKTSYVFRITVK